MRWFWARYDNGVNHAVPASLLLPVLISMEDADPPGVLHSVTELTELTIDLPGMTCTIAPTEQIVYEGLKITIPSGDMSTLLSTWMRAGQDTIRTAPGIGWVITRFMGHFERCIVVDERRREELLDTMRARTPAAEARAQEFWASRETPQQVLRAYNAKAGVVSEAAYGPDKHARFKGDKGDKP